MSIYCFQERVVVLFPSFSKFCFLIIILEVILGVCWCEYITCNLFSVFVRNKLTKKKKQKFYFEKIAVVM